MVEVWSYSSLYAAAQKTLARYFNQAPTSFQANQRGIIEMKATSTLVVSSQAAGKANISAF